jgi:lauroyl/myristoyl acyltransferase
MFLDTLIAWGYFVGWRIVRWLPEKFAYDLFRWIGVRVRKRNGKSVQRLKNNLQRVQPGISDSDLQFLLSKAMDSYMRYWCDTFRSPDWTTERIRRTVSVSYEELLVGPMREGTGVIVALPHAGNWDHAGSYFCSMGLELVTVAERLKPEALFRRFLQYREAIGMEVLALDGRSTATLIQRARSGKLIALVADRDLSKSGVEVDFFGAPAKMPAGPALLAIRTGVPLITAFVSYHPNGIHIDLQGIEIPEEGDESEKVQIVVQRCANHFAEGIKRHPHDWHMLQRIWVDGDFKERNL